MSLFEETGSDDPPCNWTNRSIESRCRRVTDADRLARAGGRDLRALAAQEGEGWIRPVWPDNFDAGEHSDPYRAFCREKMSIADDLDMIYGFDWVLRSEIAALRRAREMADLDTPIEPDADADDVDRSSPLRMKEVHRLA